MSDPGRSEQPRRGLRRTLSRFFRAMGPGGIKHQARREDSAATHVATDTVLPPEPAAVAVTTAPSQAGGATGLQPIAGGQAASAAVAGALATSAGQAAPAPVPDDEAERPLAVEGGREATPVAAGPAVEPPLELAPDSELPAHVVDPLERTRAALADARRQMPGMLGTALPPGEDDAPSSERRLVSAGAAERMAADWRAIVAELHEERRHLAEEVAGLRGLVADLRGDMSRLVGIVGAVQLALPQPAIGSGTALQADEIGEQAAGLTEEASSPANPRTAAHDASAAPAPAASHERPWLEDDDGQAPPVPPQDFGWRFRPESLPPLDTTGEWQPPEAADFEHEEAESRPTVLPEPTTQPEAHPHPETTPVSPAEPVFQAEPETEPVEFAAGSSLLVVAGPLQGVRQVTAIESSLAALSGVGPVTLVSFRGREATFRAAIAAATPLASVRRTVEANGGEIGACTVDPDGHTVRIELSRVPLEATGRA